MREAEEINSQIGNVDLKMKTHINKDKSLKEEANKEMDKVMKRIND